MKIAIILMTEIKLDIWCHMVLNCVVIFIAVHDNLFIDQYFNLLSIHLFKIFFKFFVCFYDYVNKLTHEVNIYEIYTHEIYMEYYKRFTTHLIPMKLHISNLIDMLEP